MLNLEVQTHPTWAVNDSSKLQDYLKCPRLYLFKHGFGWKEEKPNIHLEFGSAWHRAQEQLLSLGYTPEGVAAGFTAFLSHYRQFFSVEDDDILEPKTPAVALRALAQYTNTFRDDSFDVLHIEVAGTVATSSNKVIHFKTDTLCHGSEGYFSLEHKTSGRFSTTWAAQWRQKLQVGTYTHVLFCLYPEQEVYGVVINGFFPSSPPKLRRDGEPYANAKDNEFHRIPVRRNLASMEAWLVEVNELLESVEREFARLLEAREDDVVLAAFPRNTESCVTFGLCPFLDYCSVWNNPLRYAHDPPLGFKVEHWDPRTKEEKAGKVVAL